jgi:hypothetical protein
MTLHPVSWPLSVQQASQAAAELVLDCGSSAITHANLLCALMQ